MSDDKRAAFEAWYSNSGKWPQAFRRSGESYVYAECAHAWTVWQAAAAYERQRCADFVPLYTADQMREAIAAERALLLTDIAVLREALDEAATDCELHPLYLGDSATLDDIIRAGGDAAFVTGLARGLREARGSAAEKE